MDRSLERQRMPTNALDHGKRKPPGRDKPRKKGEPCEWIPAVKQPLEPIGLHECRHT
jgi:hypothetical protein